MTPEASLRGRAIVCVGFADWRTELQTNQHHLMTRLARDNPVLFVESLGLRRPTIAGRDVSRVLRRLVGGLRGPRELDGVHVLSPLVLPFHDKAWARRLNAWLLPWMVGRAARRLDMREPILWGYVPQAEMLLDVLRPSQVVYHCVDDIAAQERIDTDSFVAAERRFARRADLVLASAPSLAERLRTLSAHVLYAPNVADTAAFAKALEPGPVDPTVEVAARPRIVFTGAISSIKLDVELLVAVARARPAWSLVLVGPVGLGDPTTDVTALEAEPNIVLAGARSYSDLPAVLRGADAGIIPYRRSALTDSIFPMKVYEYLAAGLPVVSAPLPALQDEADVTSADGADAMVTALEAALHADTPTLRAQRSVRAATHSWDARLAEIAAALS